MLVCDEFYEIAMNYGIALGNGIEEISLDRWEELIKVWLMNACNKDIFRTIFEHSLSNVSFYSIGCDLLSEEQCDFDFALNSELIAFFNKNMPYACVNTNSDDLEKTKIGILNINKDGYLSLNYNNYNPFENPSIKTPIILSKNFNKKLNCQKALDYLNLQEMIYDYNLSESK